MAKPELQPTPPCFPESRRPEVNAAQERRQSKLHDALWFARPTLVELCGDSVAATALAGAFRILEATDDLKDIVRETPGAAIIAALLSVGIKLNGSDVSPDLVRALWKKIAGQAAIEAVRKTECKMLNIMGGCTAIFPDLD